MMGILLLFNGAFMLFSALISWYFKDGAFHGILYAGTITMLFGSLLQFSTMGFKKQIKKREGYLVVTLGWVIMSLSGTLPYIFTGTIPSFTNAFFETMSGYTTTGATIIDNIEAMPKSILFWRSTTHWIGGMGIIVLAIAILPLLERQHHSQQSFHRHCMATHSPAGKEIAGTTPRALIIGNCMSGVCPLEHHSKLLKSDSFRFFSILLGLLNLADHP